MICREVQKLLSAYLDGELIPEEAQVVSQHLDSCTECAALIHELEDVSSLFRSAFPLLEVSSTFEAMVMSRIDETIQQHQTFRITAASVWNSVALLALTGIVLLSPVGAFLWGIAHVMVRLVRHLYMLLVMTMFSQGWLIAGIVVTVGFLLAVWSISAMRRLMHKVAV